MREAFEAPQNGQMSPVRSHCAALLERHCGWLIALVLGMAVLFHHRRFRHHLGRTGAAFLGRDARDVVPRSLAVAD